MFQITKVGIDGLSEGINAFEAYEYSYRSGLLPLLRTKTKKKYIYFQFQCGDQTYLTVPSRAAFINNSMRRVRPPCLPARAGDG